MDALKLLGGRTVAQVNRSLLALERSEDISVDARGMLFDAVDASIYFHVFPTRLVLKLCMLVVVVVAPALGEGLQRANLRASLLVDARVAGGVNASSAHRRCLGRRFHSLGGLLQRRFGPSPQHSIAREISKVPWRSSNFLFDLRVVVA